MADPYSYDPEETAPEADAEMEVLISYRARLALAQILDTLETAGLPLPARVVNLVPGEAVVDEFGDGPDYTTVVGNVTRCGQLTARVANVAPHVPAGNTVSAAGPGCDIDYWVITVEVILTRCSPILGEGGSAPTPGALTANAFEIMRDTRAVLETLRGLPYVKRIGPWLPRGPLGGRAGSRFTFDTWVDAP